MAKRGRKKAEPGSKLSIEEKAEFDNASNEDLRSRAASAALYASAQTQAMRENPDVIQAKEKYKEVTADYRAEIKAAQYKVDYAKYLLESRGKL